MLRGNSRGKVIPPKIPKTNTLEIEQLPIFHQFKKVMNSQQRKFKLVHVHCDQLQKSVQSLQNLVLQFEQKIQQYMEAKGIEEIHSLKQKQNSFIIQELNLKIKKLSRKQIELHDQVKRLKADNVALQQQVSSNQRKSKMMENELQNELVAELKQKNLKIIELNQKIQYLTEQTANIPKNTNKGSSLPPLDPSKKKITSTSQYQQLANRLKDIESLMDLQTQQYKEKIQNLEQKYAILQQQKQKNESKFNSTIYQLQLKLNQQKSMCKQLEQANNSLLAKSSENQIMLHQQIMNLKKNINEEKKVVKNLKKQYHNGLNDLSKMVIDKAILFNSSKVQDQCHQLAKQIVKIQKRATNSAKQLHLAQIKQLTEELQRKNKQLIQLQEKIKNERSTAIFASSQNVNSSFNKSSDKGQVSQEKYRSKFQNMKKDLKTKQNRIYEMQQQLDKQFNQSTQKILKLEQQYLIKNNQCRRKDQMLAQAQEQVKSLQQKLQMGDKFKEQLRQQYHNNKEAIQATWREKFTKMEQAAHTYRNNLKETEAREQELTGKFNKLKAKYDKADHEHAETIKNKNDKIDQLTKKNHSLLIENRVNKEKMAFEIEIIKAEQTNSNQSGTATPNKDLIDQIQMERDRIIQDYQVKKQQVVNLDYDKKVLLKKVSTLQQLLQEQKSQKIKVQSKIQSYKVQIQSLKKELKNRIESDEKEHHSSFLQIKKQYQRVSQAVKSLQKSYEKKKKEYEEAVKSRDKYKSQATTYKSQADKYHNKLLEVQHQLQGKNQEKQSIVLQYKCKISEQEVKIKELLKIIEYRKINPDQSCLNESIKQNDSPLQPLIVKQTQQVGINTDAYQQKKQQKMSLTPTKVPTQKQSQSAKKGQDKEMIKDNLFSIEGNEINDLQDNFQICDEGDMNYGQHQINWRMKEFFNCFRIEIQKLFNGEDPSIEIIKIIPAQLEEDYNQFIAYLKQKISQLHHQNQISFINVIIGNQPDISQTSLDLPQIISKGQSQEKWKFILMEKQAVINSLIAQKTEQQNTINQLTLEKQEIQEENENRFMNQCNIYKKQIKQHKKTLDVLEMNYQSMKNLMKNIMEIWVSQDDMEDDLRDNLELYGKVARLSDKQRSRLNYYIMKYKELKKIE